MSAKDLKMSLYRKQKSSGSFYVRIAIPKDLRPAYNGKPQVCKALKTEDRQEAELLAARFLLKLQIEFSQRRNFSQQQSSSKKPKPEEIKKNIHRRAQILFILCHLSQIPEERLEILDELKTASLMYFTTEFTDYDSLFGDNDPNKPKEYKPKSSQIPHGESTYKSLQLSAAIQQYLSRYEKENKFEMLESLRVSLSLFLQIIGDKEVSALTQDDLVLFFDTVEKLPPDWKFACKKQQISPLQLASTHSGRVLSASTVRDKYRAGIIGFVNYGQGQLHDYGFDGRLKPQKIMLKKPTQDDAEGHQRALTVAEFDKLCDALTREYNSPRDAQKIWFVLLGLFTGARIREICQLNPMVDFHMDQFSNTHYFEITDKTAAADGVKKTLKNPSSRRTVPLHKKLIELGFLDYVNACKVAGLKQLFPCYPAQDGNASAGASKRFAQFLSRNSIRDETPGAQITGHHCFRSTLIHIADNQRTPDGTGAISIDVSQITGHKSSTKTPVYAGYAGKSAIDTKRKILEAIVWPFNFDKIPRPPAPDFSPKLSKRQQLLATRPIRK